MTANRLEHIYGRASNSGIIEKIEACVWLVKIGHALRCRRNVGHDALFDWFDGVDTRGGTRNLSTDPRQYDLSHLDTLFLRKFFDAVDEVLSASESFLSNTVPFAELSRADSVPMCRARSPAARGAQGMTPIPLKSQYASISRSYVRSKGCQTIHGRRHPPLRGKAASIHLGC